MTEKYRIRSLTDREAKQGYRSLFRVERKTSWFSWELIEFCSDADEFQKIVSKDMEKRKYEGERKYARNSFKPIHAAAYWFRRAVKDSEPELRITIDTKG